jgi:hypothetical protein
MYKSIAFTFFIIFIAPTFLPDQGMDALIW